MRMLATGMLLVATAAFAAEQPADFAYGLQVKFEGEEAFFQVELPAAVYQGVARSDLGDLRVFNGAGEVVPHALKPRELAGKTPSPPAKLATFPLKGDEAAGIGALELRVQKDSGGMIVNLRSPAARPAGATLLGYLVDASALKQALRALDLDWEPVAEGFAGRMRVEASNDLSHWRVVVSNAALVNLEFGGQRLLQKRIELPARPYKYLRLSWPAGQKPLVLTAVSGELSEIAAAAPRQWREVAGATVADKPNEYEFDLAGRFPLDRLRVALPQQNTVVRALVLSRARTADPWRPVATVVLYRFRRQGQEVLSPDIVIATDHDRYWLLRVDARGGGLGAGLPTLSTGWVPHQPDRRRCLRTVRRLGGRDPTLGAGRCACSPLRAAA